MGLGAPAGLLDPSSHERGRGPTALMWRSDTALSSVTRKLKRRLT